MNVSGEEGKWLPDGLCSQRNKVGTYQKWGKQRGKRGMSWKSRRERDADSRMREVQSGMLYMKGHGQAKDSSLRAARFGTGAQWGICNE